MYTRKCRLGALLPGFLLLSLGLLAGCQQQNIKGRPLSMEERANMQKCMIECTQISEQNLQQTDRTLSSINSASAALDSGNTQEAKKLLAEVKQNIQTSKIQMSKMQEKMPCANACCPLSGEPIDMANVPKEKIRMHKNIKLGFHNNANMDKWDNMSEAERDEKAKQVLPKGSDAYLKEYIR